MIPRHVYTRAVDWPVLLVWAYCAAVHLTVAYLVWRNR